MANVNTNTGGNEAKQNEWRSREIGALWKRESKGSGKKYLAGHVKVNELGTEVVLKVVVFPNTTKKSEKSPDFVVYVSKDEGQPTAAAPTSKPAVRTPQAQKRVAEEVSDDVL